VQDPNTGKWSWAPSVLASCTAELDCLGPRTTPGYSDFNDAEGNPKEMAGECFPMNLSIDGKLCAGFAGLGGETCCAVSVTFKQKAEANMLDLGGENLVDLNNLDIDEERGVSDITEGVDYDLIVDSDHSPLIELSGPIGLEDSDGTHLFDSGLPTEFPLLEG